MKILLLVMQKMSFTFYCKMMPVFLFLHFKSLIESFVFHKLLQMMRYTLEIFLFLEHTKILRATVGLFFSKVFQSSIFEGYFITSHLNYKQLNI